MQKRYNMLAFVILHYKNINDTVECLESIKKINNQEQIKIIIVDNNTLNEEEHELLKEYTEDIILLKDNLGFAKANNEGAKYAMHNQKSEQELQSRTPDVDKN